MDYAKLTTTIVSGLLALAMLVAITVLIVAGQEVPDEFIPFLMLAGGAAIGGARAAS